MLRNEDYGLRKIAYSVNETLELLSIGRTTLYELVKTGRLKPVRIGRRTLFTSLALADFLDSVRTETVQ